MPQPPSNAGVKTSEKRDCNGFIQHFGTLLMEKFYWSIYKIMMHIRQYPLYKSCKHIMQCTLPNSVVMFVSYGQTPTVVTLRTL